MPRRALLIVNEKSRNGAANLEASRERLKAYGIEPIYRACERREDLSRLIVEQGKEVDLVVIGGGDGTINAAAEGVIEEGLPLGILPLGTANDLASTLGVPPDLDAAARIIAAGRTRRIDLGLVNGQPFFNVASLGLSAELAQELTSDTKRRFGRLSYGHRRLARALPGPALQRRHLEPRGHGAREDAPDRRRQRALLRRRQRRRERTPRSTTSISTSTASSSSAPGSWR